MTGEIYDIGSLNFVDNPLRPCFPIYFAGCNLRCRYCFNMNIVKGRNGKNGSLEWARRYIEHFCQSIGLKGVGVVFSGGEPTVSPYFKKALEVFKGWRLAIHTNGIDIPRIINPFESVILSVKTAAEYSRCMEPHEYPMFLVKAVRYYQGSKNKEFRIVGSGNKLQEALSYIEALRKGGGCDLSGWTIKTIEEIKPMEDCHE